MSAIAPTTTYGRLFFLNLSAGAYCLQIPMAPN